MINLALALRSNAVTRGLSAIQRAINILKSAGPGAWYDPSDITNYMATGPELVANGTFDSDLSGWTLLGTTLPTWSANGLVLASDGSFFSRARQSFATVIGRTYEFRLDVIVSAGTLKLDVGTTAGASDVLTLSLTSTGGRRGLFVASSTTTHLEIETGSTASPVVDNISVRELTNLAACTMFQDSAGTTPVTAVEQPVGLMLDKSKGLVLGSELVTNGDGSSTVGWGVYQGSVSASGGNLVFTSNAGGSYPSINQTVSLVVGKQYLVTITGTTGTSGHAPGFNAGSGFTPAVNAPLTSGAAMSYVLTATATSTILAAFVVSGSATAGTTLFDNISVRELPGNHLIQPTATSRPRLSARKNWLLATEVLSTQSVTTKSAAHVLSFYGTGTVTLSGTSTAGPLVGTGVSDRVSLTFTPTAGTLTLTVSGSVTRAQLEDAT